MADAGDLSRYLDGLYERFNRRRYVEPDPLQFLYAYPDLRDREIAALAASGLAYGRVRQIVRNLSTLFQALGPCPADTLLACGGAVPGCVFRHRFTEADELQIVLNAAASVQAACGGTLQGAFPARGSIVDRQRALVEAVLREAGLDRSTLLPDVGLGSACKRLNLMFRWLVREDEVDPGGWTAVDRSELLVPVDVHMHRIGVGLGFTARRQADMATVREITDGFRRVRPDDPVRYDFCLTRPGIQGWKRPVDDGEPPRIDCQTSVPR